MQVPKPEADTNVRTETCHPKCKEDALSVSVLVKVQQEVKEEFDSLSGGSRAPLPAQSSQASFREGGQPYEPERHNSRQNDQAATDLVVPWADVMNELRSVQQSCRRLRTPAENGASEVDVIEVTSRQDALTTRMERFESCLTTVTQDQKMPLKALESVRQRWTHV